jgi:ferredoxin
MRVVVDLARCESYGQCVFAAPEIFELTGPEVLEYDSAPGDHLREQAERARVACPVQAITIGPAAGPAKGAAAVPAQTAAIEVDRGQK